MSLQLKESFPPISLPLRHPLFRSGLQDIDHFMEGGLALGQVSEWGLPWGSGGRSVIMNFIAQATQAQTHCLWVHDQADLDLFPPTWQAMGSDLSYLRVALSKPAGSKNSPVKLSRGFLRARDCRPIHARVIEDLKPIFMSSFFKLIVIDCHISPQDYAFLAQRARQQKQLIFVLRKHPLSSHRGNVWAKTRFNAWREPFSGYFYIKSLKGLSPRQIRFRLQQGGL